MALGNVSMGFLGLKNQLFLNIAVFYYKAMKKSLQKQFLGNNKLGQAAKVSCDENFLIKEFLFLRLPLPNFSSHSHTFFIRKPLSFLIL